MMTTLNKERETNKMTAEEQDYGHLSKVLASYVLRDDEARRTYMYAWRCYRSLDCAMCSSARGSNCGQ